MKVRVDIVDKAFVRLMLHKGWDLAYEPDAGSMRWHGPKGWWADVDFDNDPILYRLWLPDFDADPVTCKSVKEFDRKFEAFEAPAVPVMRKQADRG